MQQGDCSNKAAAVMAQFFIKLHNSKRMLGQIQKHQYGKIVKNHFPSAVGSVSMDGGVQLSSPQLASVVCVLKACRQAALMEGLDSLQGALGLEGLDVRKVGGCSSGVCALVSGCLTPQSSHVYCMVVRLDGNHP